MAQSESGEDSDDGSSDDFLRQVAQIDSPSDERDGDGDDEGSGPEQVAGTRLGRFVLGEEVGRGGMGIVFRAEDDALGRTIAIKVLGRGRDRSAQRRARFLREARCAAAIVHPNVAAVYEVGEADACLFIAMELVSGESLRQRFAADRALPASDVIAIARGIARGLEAAHAQGIVHRDLKPENVMMAVSGEPKILDFGLAKLRDARKKPTDAASTEDGRILGTPSYMSPEQAAGKAIDARSDLFSLGVILYEALSGGRPFVGETSQEILAAVMRDTPRSLAGASRRVPPRLAALVMACLAKAAADRPASAKEFLERLDVVDVPKPSSWRWIAVAIAIACMAGLVAKMRTVPVQATVPVPESSAQSPSPAALASAVARSPAPAVVASTFVARPMPPPSSSASQPAVALVRSAVPAAAAPSSSSAKKRDPLGDQF